ncbi:MAG: YihY/virulence factor BrkB family protein [Flavobacteriales bacterium]|nr:YihY/virulence factor BrkB family protein [Flavobacteriales bacterium]
MLRKLIVRILHLPIVRNLLRLSKEVRFPGFEGLPLYDVMAFFIKGMQKGWLNLRASAVAFNFILAIFPAIIFLFTLIAYIPINGFQEQLLEIMQVLLPESVFASVSETFTDIITRQRGGLLSVTVISALYFSTNGVSTLIDSFNTTYHTIESRPYLIQRVYALLITVILAVFTLIGVGLIIFGQMGMEFISQQGWIEDGLARFSLNVGRWIIIVALIFFAISVLYFFGPAKQTKWRFFSAGSSLATVLVLITSLGFTYFVESFGQYNKLYGSIGTLVIVMLWMLFNSIALLIGFELNASIEDAKLREIELGKRSLGISLEEEIERGGNAG